MIQKRNRKSILILIFSISFILHEIFNLFIPMIRFNPDELGSLSGAAYTLGYNWKPLLNYLNADYGIVFGLLFTPLFFIIRNPFHLYQAMLAIVAIFLSANSIVAFKILEYINRDLNAKPNTLITSLFAIACSFFTSWRGTNVMNEVLLTNLVWLLAYGLVRTIAIRRINTLDYLYLFLTYILLLLTHTRAIIVIIAFNVCALLYTFSDKSGKMKQKILNVTFIIIITIVSYLLSSIFKKWIYSDVFGLTGSSGVSNTVSHLVDVFDVNDSSISRASIEGIQGLLDIFLSNYYVIFITSFGIIPVLFFDFMVDSVNYFRQWYFKGRVVIQQRYYIMLFCLLGIIGSLIGFSLINWGYVLAAKQYGVVISYFFYPRYFGIFYGPMLCCFASVKRKRIPYLCFFSLLFSYVSYIYISESFLKTFSSYGGDVLDAWRVTAPLNLQTEWRSDVFYRQYTIAFAVASLLSLTLFVLEYLNKRIVGTIVLALLIYQYGFNSLIFDRGLSIYVLDLVSASYDWITSSTVVRDSDKIYVVDGSTNPRATYVLQFLFPNKSIIVSTENDLKNIKDGIIVTNQVLDKRPKSYSEVQLDENEYVYFLEEDN